MSEDKFGNGTYGVTMKDKILKFLVHSPRLKRDDFLSYSSINNCFVTKTVLGG